MGLTILLTLLVTCFSMASTQLLGGAENIDDLTDPAVVAAANASVQYLNGQNPPGSKELILVRIRSGTQQIIEGIRYRLTIEVAPAQTCLNDNITSTIDECPVDTNSTSTWVIVIVASTAPVMYTVESAMMPLPGGVMNIDSEALSDPLVIGAACAAVDQITALSNSIYKSVLVHIENGTYQVVNGLRYNLLIVVALSTTCERNSELCTSMQCPIDEDTQMQWMVSVVAPPTPVNMTINYMVLNASRIMGIGQGVGRKMELQNLSDPMVVGAACAAVDQITEMSNSEFKSVLVSITSGTYQVVNGIRYDMLIVVALSTTCTRNSNLCTSIQCPIDDDTQMQWMVSVVAPPTPVNMTINYMVLNVSRISQDVGRKMELQNFSDPMVVGAACAAVDQITEMSNSEFKSVLVSITSGTYQVVNGLRYDMLIVVALSTTCTRNSTLCTSMQCPIDEGTRMQWMVSVVAPPTPPNELINYDVLSVTQVTGGSSGVAMSHWLFTIAAAVICIICNFSI